MPDILTKSTTSALTHYRLAIGWTQKKLAEKSGVNLRTIENWECGRTDIRKASADKLQRVARALKCSIEDLIKEGE